MSGLKKPQINIQGYYYDAQLKRYLTQFMSIFAGLTVKTGKRENGEQLEIEVPIVYGSKDRVVAAMMAGNTQNKPIRLPTMSAYMTDLAFNPQRNAGAGMYRTTAHLPQGGILPNDVSIVHQVKPVPYDMMVDLTIYTSNIDQHFQMLEQVLTFFSPTLMIQSSDAALDWTKIVSVELQRVSFNENYPAGTDRRKIQTTLSFYVPIWISPPAEMKQNLVKKIMARIHTGSFEDFVIDSQSPDEEGYEVIASADQLNVNGQAEE